MELFAHSCVWLAAGIAVAALLTAFASRVFLSVIALALTSALTACAIYLLDAPLAAVIVLSVSAGLIPAVFILAVGFTSRLDAEQVKIRQREMLRRYWLLPLVMLVAVIALSQVRLDLPQLPAMPETVSARELLWDFRKADLLGQAIAIMAGVFGVVVLLSGQRRKKNDE